MSLVNAWWGRDGAGEAERRAYVTCDGCLPPREVSDCTAAELSALGWEFDDLEKGPHHCRWCARKRRGGHVRRSPPHERPALPNLLIIGAAKSGTTSLHRYLATHPDVYMSEIKELRFFQDPACLDRLETYATFFDANRPVRGESSHAYSAYPLAPGVPERIRAAIPDARLIYLVRDPVERTLSHYAHRRNGGLDLSPLDEVLGDPADPRKHIVASSMYAMQLEQYVRLFPREQLLVIDNADLLGRRRETLRSVFRFLDVDEDFWSPRYEELHNPREVKVRWTRAGLRLAASRSAEAIRRLVPARPRKALLAPVKRAMTTKLEPPILDDGLRQRLRDVYREDVERLRQLTGKEFASWQI